MVRIFSLFIVIFLPAALAGCAKAPEEITIAEQAQLETPSPQVLSQVNAVLPTRLQNQIELEVYILENGRTLTEREVALARAVGVKKPNRIRILEIPHIPRRNTAQRLVNGEAIRKPAFRMAVIGGLQAGYGLVIDASYIDKEWLMAHELTHIHQYEKLGRMGMMRQVLIEHAVLGDKLIPIEREAISISESVTGKMAPDDHN